jgi:2-dehydro-3-deoxygalactonokinase
VIAVDWGTSNFRAFRLSPDGSILARRSSPQGILQVEGGRFAEALRAEVGEWLVEGEDRILLCGMIGSRQGWKETKYLPCPVGIADLAAAVIQVPFSEANIEIRLVPGVSGHDPDGVPEVMRGEETQAAGLLDAYSGDTLVCFPGTHSKWVHLSAGRITSFTTAMTGEIYGALRNHTILGHTMTDSAANDSKAFLQGVARTANSGGLLHHLFGVRTLTLMDQLKEESSASYLSGLLIGHEVRAAMPRTGHVHLTGDASLCSLYEQAIEACGGSVTVEDQDAAAHGLTAIARKLSWI